MRLRTYHRMLLLFLKISTSERNITGGGGTGMWLAGGGTDGMTCGGGMLATCTGGVCTAKPPNPRRLPAAGDPGGSGGVPAGGGGVGICKKEKHLN